MIYIYVHKKNFKKRISTFVKDYSNLLYKKSYHGKSTDVLHCNCNILLNNVTKRPQRLIKIQPKDFFLTRTNSEKKCLREDLSYLVMSQQTRYTPPRQRDT